jgi:hypothetical protein
MNEVQIFAADADMKLQLDSMDREELRELADHLCPYLLRFSRLHLMWCVATSRAAVARRRYGQLLERENASYQAYADASARQLKAASRLRSVRSARAEVELARLWEAYRRHQKMADRARKNADRLWEEEDACWRSLGEVLR